MAKSQKKKYEKFNSVDLWNYWNDLWKIEYNSPYNGIYRGKEYSILKGILENVGDPYSVLLAIDRAVKKKISIYLFSNEYESCLSDSIDNKVKFYVKKFGNEDHKKLWGEIEDIENKWTPKASEKLREKEILGKLNDWIGSIE